MTQAGTERERGDDARHPGDGADQRGTNRHGRPTPTGFQRHRDPEHGGGDQPARSATAAPVERRRGADVGWAARWAADRVQPSGRCGDGHQQHHGHAEQRRRRAGPSRHRSRVRVRPAGRARSASSAIPTTATPTASRAPATTIGAPTGPRRRPVGPELPRWPPGPPDPAPGRPGDELSAWPPATSAASAAQAAKRSSPVFSTPMASRTRSDRRSTPSRIGGSSTGRPSKAAATVAEASAPRSEDDVQVRAERPDAPVRRLEEPRTGEGVGGLRRRPGRPGSGPRPRPRGRAEAPADRPRSLRRRAVAG